MPPPPHILQILEATEGGTRRHVRELSLGLLRRGARVTLAVSDGRDPDFGRLDIPLLRGAGADVRLVPMRRGIAPAGDFRALRALRALIRETRPDVVHAHSSKAGFLGRLAAFREGVPAFYTPHAFAFLMDAPAPVRALYRALERRAAKWTACLVAVCESEAALARGLDPALRVETVPNGIPLPQDAGGPAQQAPPFAARRFDVAFVGRFCAQKAPDIFLAACARVLAARPGSRFAMMGSGALGRTERRLLRDNPPLAAAVTFFPRGGETDTGSLLRASRVLAMPSRWEGFPYLALEAMAEGTPLVTTAVGGIPEASRPDLEALLVNPSAGPAAFADAILRLLGDDALAARLAGAGRRRAREFPLDAMVNRLLGLYREAGSIPPHGNSMTDARTYSD